MSEETSDRPWIRTFERAEDLAPMVGQERRRPGRVSSDNSVIAQDRDALRRPSPRSERRNAPVSARPKRPPCLRVGLLRHIVLHVALHLLRVESPRSDAARDRSTQ